MILTQRTSPGQETLHFSSTALVRLESVLQRCRTHLFLLVAVVAGTALPYLASLDARLLKQLEHDIEDPDEEVDAEISKIKELVRQWKSEAARKGAPLLLPRMPFMLRNIWTAALLLFGVIMMSTFFITTVRGVRHHLHTLIPV